MSRPPQDALDLADIQGLLVRGYGSLPEATFLLMHVDDAVLARSTLRRLADDVTSAESAPEAGATHVALTAAGVAVLAGAAVLDGFSEQFATGMTTAYRSRLLGDVDDDDPRRWGWGGPDSAEVHVLVLLYERTGEALAARESAVVAAAESGGLSSVRRLATRTLGDREPFGFHDGISQPVLEGLPRAADGGDVVRTGEFVLGYVNEYGQRTERPLVDRRDDPDRLLPDDLDGSGAGDLGRNGSYLVLRQLEQDVDGFAAWLDRTASDGDGGLDPHARDLLAAKMVGRWPSGAPLVLDPERDDPAHGDANDFGYHATDPDGVACPVGAHIRRANPRDSLEPGPGTPASLEINHRHRVLRRGRAYDVPTGAADGAGAHERGLYFLCLNANLARQFEFVQHSWLNDPGFNLMVDATDPLVGVRHGGGGTFTVQARPLRRRYLGLPQFVHVRGGAYFFLPGIRALRYLTSGGPP